MTTRPLMRAGLAIAGCSLLALGAAPAVQAQQIGKAGWEPAARSASLSSQFQFQKKNTGSGGGSGMDALNQYVTNYNTSSTSIGNYTEVIQTLGDGASGTVTQSATQDSSGTQDATTTANENETTNGSNNPAASGKGKGDKTVTVITGVPAQPAP